MIGRRLATIATVVCASSVSAFAPAQQHSSSRIASTELNIFGGLKDAFSNDDSLGKAQNAGLTGGPKVNENVSINGKPINAVVGQKVSQVAVRYIWVSNYECDPILFCTLFCSRILTFVRDTNLVIWLVSSLSPLGIRPSQDSLFMQKWRLWDVHGKD